MSSSTSSSSSVFLALCISFFCLASHVKGFNITTILSQFSEFSSFNSYLTQTQLAGEINGRQTLTVLAVDNGVLGSVAGQPADFIKKILSIHVVLDYFDTPKLLALSNTSSMFTTLYQTTGLARNGEGFVNCTLQNKQVAFGSGAPGSPINSKLVKTVATQPYNISVLQVTNLIVPSGGGSGSSNSTPPAPATSPPPSNSPSKPPASPPKSAPTPSNSSSNAPASAPNSPPAPSNSSSNAPASAPNSPPAPSNSSSNAPGSAPNSPPAPSNSSSNAPAPSKGGDAPTPSAASSPSSDAAPTADAPKASPPQSADSPDADAPSSDDGSGATAINTGVGVSLLVMGPLSLALRAMV